MKATLHSFQARLSPALIIATLALFVALAGSAAAAVIITSPDQLKDGVITEAKLADNAVSSAKIRDHAVQQSDERDPALRARVSGAGALLRGDVIGVKKTGTGLYNLEFRAADLGSLGLDNCAFTVSPEFVFSQSPGSFNHRPMRAYAMHGAGSAIITVATYEEQFNPATSKIVEVPTDATFDLVLGC